MRAISGNRFHEKAPVTYKEIIIIILMIMIIIGGKLLWDFDIHTDHLISARRPDLIIINKIREFAKLSTLLSRLTTE